MKKVLSVFLCFFVLFHSVATPASAVKVEEVATFEDAEGHEIRVLSYGVAPANAAAGVLYLTSTGGSMGAGVASIASTALPVLGYLLAAGVIVYSVYGLANCVMDMYNLLSASALAELQEIEAAGTDNIVLSDYPALSGELPGVLENSLPSGSYASVSYSFDHLTLSQFDYTIHSNQTSTLPDSVFEYPLTAEPVLVEGTSVEISLVEAPFAGQPGVWDQIVYAMKIHNIVTGVTLYFMPTGAHDYYRAHDGHFQFFFDTPVWNTINPTYGAEVVQLIIPVTRACVSRLQTGWCSMHSNTYLPSASFEGNSSSTTGDFFMLFEGTGNAALDSILFTANYLSPTGSTLVPSADIHPGMDDVLIPQSALSLVLSDNFANVGVTDTPAKPEEDKPIFLPPSVALDNANLLTQSGALTGTWDTTIDGEKVEVETPDVGVDTEVGFWESILNWLESFWDKFVAMLQAALMGLFVPSEGFFEQFVADISATFEDRMGILTYPISLVYEFCSHLLEVGEEEPIFRWPSWSYKGTEFLPAGSFNFNDILSNSTFKGLHDIYLLIVDAGIVFGLLRLAQKKYDSIINN